MSKEINFQCPDCGICFQDSEEGAKFAAEHTRLTGHNEDLMSFDVDELQRKAQKMIDDLAPIKPTRSIIDILKEACETERRKSSS